MESVGKDREIASTPAVFHKQAATLPILSSVSPEDKSHGFNKNGAHEQQKHLQGRKVAGHHELVNVAQRQLATRVQDRPQEHLNAFHDLSYASCLEHACDDPMRVTFHWAQDSSLLTDAANGIQVDPILMA